MGCDKILGVTAIATAAVLLALVTFDVPYFKSIYFLRIDLSGAATSTVSNQSTPYMDLGVFGYCADLKNGTGLQCSHPHIGYSLSDASKYIDGSLPGFLTSHLMHSTDTLTKALVLHLVALGVTGIAFVFAFLALLGVPVVAECCADCFSGLAGTTGLVVFIFDIVFFELVKKRVEDVSHTNSAVMGNAIWLTLVAMLLLFITPILFLLGRCCGYSSRYGADREKGKGVYRPLL